MINLLHPDQRTLERLERQQDEERARWEDEERINPDASHEIFPPKKQK